jgi:hypothetical protein
MSNKMTIQDVRNMIFARDNNKCYECGSSDNLNLDHVLPKPKYQLHIVDNLLTLCWRCNARKGTKRLSIAKERDIYNYLLNANRCFSVIEVIQMNDVLAEYFGSYKYKSRAKKIKLRPSEITYLSSLTQEDRDILLQREYPDTFESIKKLILSKCQQ